MKTNRLAVLAVPVIIAGTAAVAFTASAADAAPGVTAVTHIRNAPDSGNNGTWAYDNYARTLRITLDSPQPPTGVPAGDFAYSATVTDRGTFSAIVGAYTPNQVVPGVKIAHSVSGSDDGGASYVVYAPKTDALTGNVPGALNLDFAAATGDQTTTNWPAQAFASATGVVVTYAHGGDGWSWTYRTACQAWTDSGFNGDGNLAHDGNITGKICAVPRLYDGAAVYVSPVRENVTFKQTIGSWDEFKIVGPGPINGHIGWVQAVGHGVTNAAVYGGLNANSGYTVFYTPETHKYGHQILGTHTGYVYFVSCPSLQAPAPRRITGNGGAPGVLREKN
jgi:hypothetical protein